MARRTAKDGRLLLRWSKRQRDHVVDYPKYKTDLYLLFWVFFMHHCCGTDEKLTFVEDLEKRGYDLTTLRFQIDKKEAR